MATAGPKQRASPSERALGVKGREELTLGKNLARRVEPKIQEAIDLDRSRIAEGRAVADSEQGFAGAVDAPGAARGIKSLSSSLDSIRNKGALAARGVARARGLAGRDARIDDSVGRGLNQTRQDSAAEAQLAKIEFADIQNANNIARNRSNALRSAGVSLAGAGVSKIGNNLSDTRVADNKRNAETAKLSANEFSKTDDFKSAGFFERFSRSV